jgi:hypothetical protein
MFDRIAHLVRRYLTLGRDGTEQERTGDEADYPRSSHIPYLSAFSLTGQKSVF